MKCPRCGNLPHYGPGDTYVCPSCSKRFSRSGSSYATKGKTGNWEKSEQAQRWVNWKKGIV